MSSVEIFISYAPKDKELQEELAKHLAVLKKQERVTIWYNDKIAPGLSRQIEIDKHFDTAQIHLLLISADFLESDYCYDIMQRAMKLYKDKEACIIPILLRPVYWKDTPFAKIPMLPHDAKPITTYQNQDEAMLEIVEGILEIAKEKFPGNIDISTSPINSSSIPTQIASTYGPSREGNQGVVSFLLHDREHVLHYTRIDSFRKFLNHKNLGSLKNQTILLTYNQQELLREEIPELAPTKTILKQQTFQIEGVDCHFTFKMLAWIGVMSIILEVGGITVFSY